MCPCAVFLRKPVLIFLKIYPKDDDNKIFSKNNVYYFVELSKFATRLESLDMGDERNRLLYMFTHVVYMPKEEVNNLTPMQLRFYEECQITRFSDMEKQDAPFRKPMFNSQFLILNSQLNHIFHLFEPKRLPRAVG